MKRNRFFIENYGEDCKSIIKAFDFFSETTFSNNYLILDNESFKENLYKLGVLKNKNDKIINYQSNNYQISTFKEFSKIHSSQESRIISLWLNDDRLFKIENIPGIRDIIGIPWQMESLELWEQTFGPKNIETLEYEKYLTISDKTLRLCFEHLTSNRINWSNLHSTDIEGIKTIIKKNKTSAIPNEIFAYLMREKNVNYNRSLEIKKWTEKLKEGKNVKTK